MKFIQLVADNGILYALGEDGVAYRQFGRTEEIAGKKQVDEFGGIGPARVTIHYWAKMDRFED